MTSADRLNARDAALVALPTTELAADVLRIVRPVETPSVFNHSVRSYLFARFVAGRLGMSAGIDYSDDLLFTACVMHDLGVARDGAHDRRFEVEGADRAARFLVERGVTETDADQVWQAIALHTSPGIAERRGPLCVLTREGIAVDFGGPMPTSHLAALNDRHAGVVHAAYPRLDMIRSLTDAIVEQAAKDPRNAPRYAIPGEFLGERTTHGRTRMEHVCSESRWGN